MDVDSKMNADILIILILEKKGVCIDMLTIGACTSGDSCLYTHQIPEILIKDSKFVDSVTKNEVKNSLDENSISKSAPANINTQQSSFFIANEDNVLRNKQSASTNASSDVSGKCKSICVSTNAVSVLSYNKNASITSTPGKSETIKKKKLKKIRRGRKKKKCTNSDNKIKVFYSNIRG